MRRHRHDMCTRSIRAILVALVTVTAACGHRMSDDELLAANSQVLQGQPGGAVASGPSTPGASPVASTAPGQAAPGTATTPIGEAPAAGPATGPAGESGGTHQPGSSATCATTATGPIIIGSVGNYSGLAGASVAPGVEALRAWVQHRNEGGGICGRRIELIVVDDKGDPAQHVAALRDLVEDRDVVSFVSNGAPLTAESGRSYLESVNVPVIGTSCTADAEFESPIFFSACGSSDGILLGAAHNAVNHGGVTRIAILYCAEASQCAKARDDGPELMARMGAEVVYVAQVSLAQPDFTSECRQAQQAGARAMLVALDTSGSHRVAASCARQGFRPIYLGITANIDHEFKDDPNIPRVLWNGQWFSFAGARTPAQQEFQDVMASRVGRSASPIDGNAWSSAVAFELAATRAATATRMITSASLLDALHGFRDETLGGLTVPLNFPAGQPTPAPDCWFAADSRGGEWAAVNSGDMTCA